MKNKFNSIFTITDISTSLRIQFSMFDLIIDNHEEKGIDIWFYDLDEEEDPGYSIELSIEDAKLLVDNLLELIEKATNGL